MTAVGELRLVEANAEDFDAFLEMARELSDSGEPIHQAALDDPDAWLATVLRWARGEGVPEGYVPTTSYWLFDGETAVGSCRLRHALNDSLLVEGGHIGYDVRPSRRNEGLATELLARVLEHLRARGADRACLTCDEDNLASARVIEKNGGVLAARDVSPRSGKWVSQYWIEL